MAQKNMVWYYRGMGMDSLGKMGKPEEKQIERPGKDEVLARVDALAICASDIKMINMGREYPLFRNRNFENFPAILGHELSLTVVEAGKNLEQRWKPGMRIGIQPDVYMDSIRYCVGVNTDGGMQQYILLKKPTFYSDQGETIFPVKKELSYAAVAQLEPNACVEAAYRRWGREDFKRDGSLLLYIGEEGDESFVLDKNLCHARISAFIKGKKTKKYPDNMRVFHSLEQAIKSEKEGFHDILIMGSTADEELELMINHMNQDGLFCWLVQSETGQKVHVDIAKVHYGTMNWIGTDTHCLSDAFRKENRRYELKKDGKMLIMGGAGAMGRMHTLRALTMKDGPKVIVVTAKGRKRLNALKEDFFKIAQEQGKQLEIVAINENGWKEKLRSICGKEGFDDVIVAAPGVEPVENAVLFLRKDGMLVLFSGTKYGSYTKLPIGYTASFHGKIHASSGSTVEDQKHILEKIESGQYQLDKNVMAVAGLNALKDAAEAVASGKFSGKVIVYPQLLKLPLTDLKEIGAYDTVLAQIAKNGWNQQAERRLYAIEGKEVMCHEKCK